MLTESEHTYSRLGVCYISLADVEKMTGFKKSYLYERVNDGAFPPYFKVSRSTRFIYSEVTAVMHAWALGKSEEQVMQLVADLVAKR